MKLLFWLGVTSALCWFGGPPLFAASSPPPFGGRLQLTDELEKLTEAPISLERRIAEARIDYFLGRLETERAKRLQYFERGLEKLDGLRERFSTNPGVILWWAANRGARAETNRNLASLLAIREVEKALWTLRSLDAGFGYAAADRGLGNLYQSAPHWISIGSDEKAETHLRAAVKRAPLFPGNLTALAAFLDGHERHEEARQWAEQASRAIEGARNFPEFLPEIDEWKATVASVLKDSARGGP